MPAPSALKSPAAIPCTGACHVVKTPGVMQGGALDKGTRMP